MKLSHLLLTGILTVSSYSFAQDSVTLYTLDQVPSGSEIVGNNVLQNGAVIGKIITAEQLASLNQLSANLAAATTPEAKQQIVADAVTANPGIVSDPVISGDVQRISLNAGLSTSSFDTAVITGLSKAAAPAAGVKSGGQGNNKEDNTPTIQSQQNQGQKNNSDKGGGSGSPS